MRCDVIEARRPGSSDRNGLSALLRRVFAFPAVLVTGLAVVTVLTVSNRFNDPDLWWHLRLGQIVATTHAIPTVDLFSFTAAGHPWIPHEWLAQWSIYQAFAAGGDRGLMIWLSVLTSSIFALVYVLCRWQSGNPLIAFFGGLFAWFFGTVGLAIRPLVLGHLCLVAELLILELGRTKNRRWLWCLPLLFVVWANCHGSFFFGMAVLAVYWLCSFASGDWGLITSEAWDRKRRNTLTAAMLLCAVASCCTPAGIRTAIYPINTLFQQSTGMSAVEEWLPPDLRSPRAIGMLCAAVGILVFSLARRSAWQLRELVLLLMALGLALRHERMAFLFGIVASPIICRFLGPEMSNREEQDHPVANAALILAGVAAILCVFPTPAALQKQVRAKSPVAAVEYIRRAGLSGPMLNEYVFGGYLIWALPQEKVFIDGRGDVYDWTGVFAEYGRWATLQEDPERLLNKYRIRFCLLAKGAPMARVLPYLPGWHEAFSDDVAVVFVR
jgi:hypothetical protein